MSSAYMQGELLFLHAITSLHPGCGTALGTVDLPVQRERHTQWPTIPGSALKGVMRDNCRRAVGAGSDADPAIVTVFGPPTSGADKHAGAISFTDARILAFPVRSLRGVFAWVTCPAALDRFNRDAAMAGKQVALSVPAIKSSTGCLVGGADLVTGNKEVVLEEFCFNVEGDASPVARAIAPLMLADEPTRQRFLSHFAILTDDQFNYFVQHATEVVARIGLNHETKTVSDKALFYQEFLPAETMFYSVVIASPSRNNGKAMNPAEVIDYLRTALFTCDGLPVIQVGGDETTGKGLCALSMTEK